MAGQSIKIRFGDRNINADNTRFGHLHTPVADGTGSVIRLRKPVSTDGAAISALIAQCPPLDTNSAYCNLLQCTHFADTCIVAERDAKPVGWVSGYRPPDTPEQFFVWQMAVHPSARGENLAGRMLEALLARPQAQGVTTLITTITPDNAASWAVFRAFARRHAATLTHQPHFEREAHFAGAHETEHLVSLTPASGGFARTAQEAT